MCFRTGARDHGGSSVGEREVSLLSGTRGDEQGGRGGRRRGGKVAGEKRDV